MQDVILSKVNDKSALVGIVGLGYVGLPLTLRFAEVGFRVLGFDIDAQKVDALNRGQSYIERITPASIARAQKAGFEATTDFARARCSDPLCADSVE
jgi:UDP-N-acetyl-D-glucosamine dehydrogenase